MGILLPISPADSIRMLDDAFGNSATGGPYPTTLSRQRKPETGERLDGTPKPRADGLCYLCNRNQASVYFSAAIPQCGSCYDRFRRRE
jgi:hypothetical protein